MCSSLTPTHLLFLYHLLAADLVYGWFHKAGADLLAVVVPLAVGSPKRPFCQTRPMPTFSRHHTP
jgi:hypothetical protein